MKRFSKKRESILSILRSTNEHPSAEWIYEKAKRIYPNLSLSTVYRNINQLKDEGYVRSVGIVLGEERFDAITPPHTHAVCIRCGKIIDVDLPVPSGLTDRARDLTGFTISEASLQLTGLCPDCKKEAFDLEKVTQ